METEYALELTDTFKVGEYLIGKHKFSPDIVQDRRTFRFFIATEDDVRDYSGIGNFYYRLMIERVEP
jgi:hypothetical protein